MLEALKKTADLSQIASLHNVALGSVAAILPQTRRTFAYGLAPERTLGTDLPAASEPGH
jgi:hypothetical protein